MKHAFPLRLTTAAALAALLTLGACGGGGGDDDDPVAVGDTVLLTADGRVTSINRNAPGIIVGTQEVRGLPSGEQLVGLDRRPATGRLVALSNRGRLFHLDPATGDTALIASLNDGAASPQPIVLLGSRFGVDFNPTVDRLRVVSDLGQNLRINVDTGATVVDGILNLPGAPLPLGVTGAGYTNSFDGATATELFVLNADDDKLYLQNPPNNGTLSNGVTLGVAFDNSQGFDIDAVNNVGVAALSVGPEVGLYILNLSASTNIATKLGPLAPSVGPVVGLALNDAGPAPSILALTETQVLVSFSPRSPNNFTAGVRLSGLAAGEQLLGLDVRPADRQVYALSNLGRVMRVDPVSGVATAIATLRADPAGALGASGQPFTTMDAAATHYAIDFNPVPDRLRAISSNGQSLRINVDTGVTLLDQPVNRSGTPAEVVGAAYTFSVTPSPRAATVLGTELLNLDATSDVLTLQDPPNNGTQVNRGPLGQALVGGRPAGFDIAGSRNGLALMATNPAAGPSVLYQVNLSTGAATLPRGLTAETARIGGAGAPAIRDFAIRF